MLILVKVTLGTASGPVMQVVRLHDFGVWTMMLPVCQ
jgi:hypothetical protein